jgi:hypothetical protein
MKPVRILLMLAALPALGLAGCATAPRFEFGAYDTALYAYSKHPDQLAHYETALQEAIANGRTEGRLAPGLQAELGYCYLGEGKKQQAVELFKAEMADFPEARAFLSKIIAQNAG